VKDVVPHFPTTPADFDALGLLLLSVITLSNWMLATGVEAPRLLYVLLCLDDMMSSSTQLF